MSVYTLTQARAVDGDTVAGILSRTVEIGMGFWQTTFTPEPVSIRLIRLDTPERGENGYLDAKVGAAVWLEARRGRLEVELLGAGGFDRDLGDVYATGDRGDTLTQAQLRAGWAPWLG